MAQDSEIMSTGDMLLDQRLGGGVPVGSLILIDGDSGAGKSVLAQHFISGALTAERRVVLYSSENTESSLLSQMDSLGMDVADLVTNGSLKVHHLPAGSAARKASIRLESLRKHMSKQGDWDLVVVDSLTGVLASESDESLFSFFSRCKQYHTQGKTIIIIVHTNAISDSNLTRIAPICDVYLRLRVQVVDDKLVKSLEVAKVRGGTDTTGRIVTFDVESGLGIVPTMTTTKVQG
jgi:flagellar protein FlaH